MEIERQGGEEWKGVSDIVEKKKSVSDIFLNCSKGDEIKLGWWLKEYLSGLFKRGEKKNRGNYG